MVQCAALGTRSQDLCELVGAGPLDRLVPSFGDTTLAFSNSIARLVTAKRLSFRPSHPDSLPVIGRSPKQENDYLAYGHGHLGFTLGGITGELIGQLVNGEETTVDLEPYRPTRFRMLGRRLA